MFSLEKIVHVLTLGLWFGSVTFFTFAGVSLIDTFEKATEPEAKDRPYWLPAPTELEKERPSERFPTPLRKEQGSRLFGLAVGPMFRPYFLLQVACGVLAGLSALTWFGRGGVHKARVLVLLLALIGAASGWWLEGEVEGLRVTRNSASDAVLTSASPTAEQIRAADEARGKFTTWHFYSLGANFATLALVTVAMAMAAYLPAEREPS
jgi:hypothetical protein